MTDLYSDGGWTMYPTTLFGLLAVAAALVLAMRPERRYVPLVIALIALTLSTGFMGTMWGLTGVVKAATNADPADMRAIIAACATQALNSLLVASVFIMLATVGSGVAALRVAMRPAPAS